MAEADRSPVARAGWQADIRASPTEDFIQSIRRRFPVEREIDRILTR